MAKMVITHGVVDVDNWLKGKAERAEQIAGMGGGNVVDHVAQDGSKAIAVTFDTDDVARVMAALAAPPPELTAAMERHGVVPPFTAYVAK